MTEEKRAIFLSPNWGGFSYLNLQNYSVDNTFPPFRDILKTSLKLSKNLILYLPKNTDIRELLTIITKMYSDQKEVYLEIEQIIIKQKVKVLVIYTEALARITANDIARYMEENVFDVSLQKAKDKDYLKKLLRGILAGRHC